MKEKTVSVDVPQITEKQATQLCIHHLGLAASYFEASGPELKKDLLEARTGGGLSAISLSADMEWLLTMIKIYNALEN